MLVGCTYLNELPSIAEDAIAVARALFDEVSLIGDCCGLPLLLAGDRDGFARHARALGERHPEVLAVDPGCAATLRGAGVRVRLLVEEIATRAHLRPLDPELAGPVRWHDPCQLGRGLGVYEAPRQILTRALGAPPAEFPRARAKAACSGGGGLLPKTMPETARAIAADRRQEHDAAGGGTIVTACASSVLSFRKAGAEVTDLVTVARRAMRA